MSDVPMSSKDLFAHSQRLCRLDWQKAASIYHFLARFFAEQRYAARRARLLDNILCLSRGASSTPGHRQRCGDLGQNLTLASAGQRIPLIHDNWRFDHVVYYVIYL
jgi:hypothetical protein